MTVSGSESMPASTAAANGSRSVAGLVRLPTVNPPIPAGAERMAPTPESPAATIQVMRLRFRTGMPSSMARSLESAAPRMATP